MESILLDYLAAGGDIGILAVAYGLFRVERRLFRLELKVHGAAEG